MSETVQEENEQGVLTSAVPQAATLPLKELNAEAVTALSAGFLKRIGHKTGLKPKRVSLEEGVYTVEVETKKCTATIKVDKETRQIREYDVQPKSEESPLSSLAPKTLIIMIVISAIVTVGISFALKIFGV